jgi:hypothetical protein
MTHKAKLLKEVTDLRISEPGDISGCFFFIDDIFYVFIFLLYIHLFTCPYIVWVISPPHPSSLPGITCSFLISNFVEEKI